MDETPNLSPRADIDIKRDIERIIARYPPLAKDRHAIHIHVRNGVVTLSGYTQTPITLRYFLDQIPTVAGVMAVEAEKIYDDSSTRLEVGRVVPVGVQSTVRYGTVALSGNLPSDANSQALIEKVQAIAGVAQVIVNFS